MRTTDGGFTLIEFLVALSIGMGVAVMYLSDINDRVELAQADLTIRETNEVISGLQNWIVDNGGLPGGAGCATAIADVEDDGGYFSIADGVNAFGNAMTPSCTTQSISITQSVPAWLSGYVAAHISGASVTGGTDVRVTFDVGVSRGLVTEPYIHTTTIAGRPELNRRNGVLDFGSVGDLVNVGTNTSNRFTARIMDVNTVSGGEIRFSGGNTTATIDDLRTGQIQATSTCTSSCPPGGAGAMFSGDLSLWADGVNKTAYVKGSPLGAYLSSVAGAAGTLVTPSDGILWSGGQKLVISDGTTSYRLPSFFSTSRTTTSSFPPGTYTWTVSDCSGIINTPFIAIERPQNISAFSIPAGGVVSASTFTSSITLKNETAETVTATWGCRAPAG